MNLDPLLTPLIFLMKYTLIGVYVWICVLFVLYMIRTLYRAGSTNYWIFYDNLVYCFKTFKVTVIYSLIFIIPYMLIIIGKTIGKLNGN